MFLFDILFNVLQIIWMLFLLLPVLTVVVNFFIQRKKEPVETSKEYDYAVIITAYEEIHHSYPLVESLLQQTYNDYMIYLVADNCKAFQCELDKTKVKVLYPIKSLHSKVKSINYAIQNFIRPHDNIIIFDADNLAHPNFIKEINTYFNMGFLAVQGQRVAKNLNSNYAGLDALGELYYNQVDRDSLYHLGSSSTLAGSGMSFELQLYIEIMNGLEVLGGFDKILQGELVKRNIRIAFAKEAVVFDEKVTKAHELRNQRTRWIHAYFKFLHYGFINLFLGVKNLCFNQFYFGLNHLRPPLFILAIVSLLFMISDLLYSPVLSVIWLFAGLMFAGNFSLILKLNKADQKIWYSLIRIPLFIYSQILSLINFKKASKKFIATEHSQWLTLNDVMKREIN